MNAHSNKLVTQFYNSEGFGRFIFATELLKYQAIRTAKILATEAGTLDGLAEQLNIEGYEAKVLLYGLEQIERVRQFVGGGVVGYEVIDNKLPEWS